MAIEYRTPFGVFSTWQEAADRCERCDHDPMRCIEIVRVHPNGQREVVR